MNRENVEQRPVSQTLCGALQKEPNCKCLVLSVLIYGCLAAVTWCRCANVTKIMVNYSKFPIRSTKHVSSPCDDGYIYIPVAFMGMLYLVYLVECYHSPIRIDLLHADSQDNVLSKLVQLKMAQPTIWWKAVSYHYVRRKRQITRYRNGDNYTTTQVYYERVNTHAATSVYYYDYCGVKDISKELILEPKIPITKIMLTKGFAFSNMRSATEFEEARSRFFAEQELRDDYMEMREGLDVGYNVNPTMLVAVLGNPWFTNRYVYWCLSALLLSWPLRVIIEYKTQYADYQVTKLFGVNYDTPTSGEPIHTSISQLSQPGSYMLAPSYSEALLMDPAPNADAVEQSQESWRAQGEVEIATDMVPSYSEALLYERAEDISRMNVDAGGNASEATTSCNTIDLNRPMLPMPCECHCPCPCHGSANGYEISVDERSYVSITTSREHIPLNDSITNAEDDTYESQLATLRTTADGRLPSSENVILCSMDDLQVGTPPKCGSCGRISTSTQTINSDVLPRAAIRNKSSGSSQTSSTDFICGITTEKENGNIPRDISEPNLRSRSDVANAFLKGNVRSLENILENEEEATASGKAGSVNVDMNPNGGLPIVEHHRRIPISLPPSLTHSRSLSLEEANVTSRTTCSRGAIPKTELHNRIIVNPMPGEACWKLPSSKTYFCLKSILKQNRRRYTLVTADEFQNFPEPNANRDIEYNDSCGRTNKSSARGDKSSDPSHGRESLDTVPHSRRRLALFEEATLDRSKTYDQKRDSTRTLIFASPLQEVFPGDPFGGKDVVPAKSSTERGTAGDSADTPVLARLSRSPAERERRRISDCSRQPRAFSVQLEHPTMYPFPHPHGHQRQRICGFPSSADDADYVQDVDLRNSNASQSNRNDVPLYNGSLSEHASKGSAMIANEHNVRSDDGHLYSPSRRHQQFTGLTRSFTERRPKLARTERNFRRSFTGRVEDYRAEGTKRMNFSMETSL